MRFVVLALLCSGCIAGSIKAHTGVVSDERGHGVQAGIALGFGIAGKRSAVIESVGFAGGEAPKAGLAVGLDYVRFLENKKLGWRAGFAGIPLAYGSPSLMGLRLASLFVVRDRYRESGHEKMESYSTRSFMAVGIEAMVGFAVYDQHSEMKSSTVGGSASLTFEMYSFSRVF